MWRALLLAAGACSFVHGSEVPGPGSGSGDASVPIDAPRDALKMPLPDATPAPFGMQWSIPCLASVGGVPTACTAAQTSPSYTNVVVLDGAASEHWMVTVEVAGAMEGLTFANGTQDGAWYVGGDTGGDNGDNYYEVTVSSPAQHYYLNYGVNTNQFSIADDYTVQLPIDGNATVTFTASPQDTLEWQGIDSMNQPIAITGFTAPPPNGMLYGQWAYFVVTKAEPM
jgi:hypothetical protein